METSEEDVELSEPGLLHRLAFEPALWIARVLWATNPAGLEKIPQDEPYILAPNHASFLDGPVMLNAMGKRRPSQEDMSFVVWKGSARGSKFIKFVFEAINAITADDKTGSPATLRRCIKWLASGKKLTVFPEGTRTKDGKLGPFIPGVGFIACKAKVPVVPVAMKGMFEVFPPDASRPRFRIDGRRPSVDVTFLDPIYPEGYTPRTMTAAIEAAIRETLGPGETARVS